MSADRSGNGVVSREFEYEVTPTRKTIIVLDIPEKGLKKERENYGINLEIKNPVYLAKRGFILSRDGLYINYRHVFEKSLQPFKRISADIINATGTPKGKDSDPVFLKFVQSIKYMIPPRYYKGKFIMEFFPPLTCLCEKYGDCDTKSVLLADLLQGSSGMKEKMAVVILKGFGIFHAILVIKRPPLPGMVSFFIDRTGPFIPMETTGKGWMPGFSSRPVIQCLQNGQFRFISLF